MAEERRLAAIMFTDMVGFTAMSQRNESLALAILTESQRIQREQFQAYRGREVKSTGDGFLAEFSSALEALQCSLAIQNAIEGRNGEKSENERFRLRIGVHLGDVVDREGDIHGDGVNVASRLEPLALPGGICISDAVAAQVRNKLEVGLAKIPSPGLKNVDAPIDVYRVLGPRERPPKERMDVRRYAPALICVGFALILAGWWLSRRTPGRAPALATAQQDASVAVLPFVNMGEDKSDEYLSDGMTEEILNSLANVPGLRVPGRTSSFAFKGKTDEDIFNEVGAKLHVKAVLEGSVRRAGKRLRVTAQLINAQDGFHIWSQTYDRDMNDVLTIQSEIAAQVASAIVGKLGVRQTQALARKTTDNPEAHRLYLLGRYFFNQASYASASKAADCFKQAIQKDPSYALAYCGLADTYSEELYLGRPGKETWAIAMQPALKAVSLDPDLAEAHVSLSTLYLLTFHRQKAVDEIQRAIELNPSLALAYDQYAYDLLCDRRFDDALSAQKKAVSLEPLSALYLADLGWIYLQKGDFKDAITQMEASLQMSPGSSPVLSQLAWCYLWAGDPNRAYNQFQKAFAAEPLPNDKADLAYVCGTTGRRQKAIGILKDLEREATKSYVDPATLGR
jgi:TolB-like protein/class 3 adenylate cyclase/Flp pilus assembly protein TadD